MEAGMQIIFRPGADYGSVAPPRRDRSHEAAEAAVSAWQSRFGKAARTADFEDFHENAAALQAAIDTGLPTFAMGRGASAGASVRAFNASSPEAQPEPGVPTVIVGRILKGDGAATAGWDTAWPSQAGMAAACRHFLNPAFARHAGRAVSVASHCQSDAGPQAMAYPALADEILRMSAAHGPGIAVKLASEQKYATVLMGDIQPGQDRSSVERWLYRHFEWGLVHVESGIPLFLVQERVRMECEYRVVVIDGKAVAGAGCVERLCPPYNRGEAFDPIVEAGRRGSGHLESNPSLVRSMVGAAEAAARDMMAEDPELRDGTYDMALIDGDRIGLIEVNPAASFGLYAMRYGLALDAMVGAAALRRGIGAGEALAA